MSELFGKMREKLRRLSSNTTPPSTTDVYKVILDQGREEFEEKYNAQTPHSEVQSPNQGACAHASNSTPTKIALGLDDFDIIKTIGTGSFGSVYLTLHKQSGTYLAMKVLNKEKVVKMKQVEHSLNEKRILHATSFPFIVSMPYSFKDNANLYMILEYINGGELFSLLRRNRRFSESQSRFYAAQMVLAVEYLHNFDIMYRDLKPENVLLDANGYIKLTDFGFAKRLKGSTFTLCGTPEYLAPEIILCKGHTSAVDWWALGILIYEMTVGHPPFYAEQPIRTYEKIVAGRVTYMSYMTHELRDLLHHLLRVDPITRYGCLRNGAADVKSHMWFQGTEWFDIYHKKVEAPFKPTVTGISDSTNFETCAEVPLQNSVVELCSKQFADF